MEKYSRILSKSYLIIITFAMITAASWYCSLINLSISFVPITLMHIGHQPFGTTLFLLVNALYPATVLCLIIVGWEYFSKQQYAKVCYFSALPLLAYTLFLYGLDK